MNFIKNLTTSLRSPRIQNRFKCQIEKVYRGSYKGVYQTAEKSQRCPIPQEDMRKPQKKHKI